MRLNIKVETAPLVLRLERGYRRLAFGTVAAIRGGLLAIQKAEREDVHRRLTVRKNTFIDRQIAIISPFPSVGQQRPFGEVRIGTPARLFLTRLEGGGDRPQKFKNLAVPITGSPARPRFQDNVPAELWISKLKFKRPRRRKKVGREVLQGEMGTFLVPNDGIFQRRGNTVVRLYTFKRHIRLPSRLRWLAIARAVGPSTAREILQREAIEAIGRTGGSGL